MVMFADRDSSDWGFEVPPAGRYLCVFEDGIRDHKNEETGKTSVIFPVKIIQEGEGEGMGFSIFGSFGGSKFEKRKFADLIVMSGLKDTFEKQFPGEIEPDDLKIVDALKAKLPGKKVIFTIKIEKYKDKEQVNVVKIEKFKTAVEQKKAAAKAEAPAATATSQAAPAGDGW
jgi:hypothetical protein